MFGTLILEKPLLINLELAREPHVLVFPSTMDLCMETMTTLISSAT